MTSTGAGGARRPYWLLTPCPTWCANTHRDEDLPEDRLHYSAWLRRVALPNAGPFVTGNGERHVPELMVYVEQHVDEPRPRVIVTEAHRGIPELRLTIEEAQQVGVALFHGTGIITEEESGARRTASRA
jgi:hypothetical protein